MAVVHQDLQALAEPERLRAVRQCDLLPFTRTAEQLAQLSARTAQALGAPIACVSVLGDMAAVHAGSHGLSGWVSTARGLPVRFAPCTQVVLTGAPYVIEDTAHDQHHRDNPALRHLGITCYAGVPVHVDGHVVGTVCVMGTRPRTFEQDEVDVLHAAAGRAGHLLRPGTAHQDNS